MWVDTLEERDRVEGHYQTNIFDMKSMLEDRIKRADDISKAYKHFKLEVAKSAEHSKTGRPISDRLLSHLEQDGEEEHFCILPPPLWGWNASWTGGFRVNPLDMPTYYAVLISVLSYHLSLQIKRRRRRSSVSA